MFVEISKFELFFFYFVILFLSRETMIEISKYDYFSSILFSQSICFVFRSSLPPTLEKNVF